MNVVTTGGTPTLTLETGTNDAVVNYSSGTGTNTLTFNYTVVEGHINSDLSYTSTSSLALNSGTIKDLALNDAILTLPAESSSNSLGDNRNLNVDGVIPTITSVSSDVSDGTYRLGQTIPIKVTFSEAVVVTGTPQLTLETGTNDAVVDYSGTGSGSNALTFNYTVAAGHSVSDLDYVSTSALALNGGTIKDVAGNASVLTLASPNATNSLGDNKDFVIDGIVPTVASVSSTITDGTYKTNDVIPILITFSEAVTVTGTPQLTLETGTNDASVNYATGSGSSILTFYYTVAAGHASSDLDYISNSALALNGGTIKDAAGNSGNLTLAEPGATNSLGANKDLVVDTVVPTVASVSSSASDGNFIIGDVIPITVTFSEAVIVSGTPQLTLETGSNDAVVNYTSGSGSTVLVFNYTVVEGHTASDLDYGSTNALALNNGTINDQGGSPATLTLPSPGATNSLGSNKALVIDGVIPTITNVTSTTNDGTYKSGDVIAITVTFSEVVNVVTTNGTPTLTLETGDSDASVNYASGSGSNTLIFNYTIADGQNSSDLDYASTSALALNSGTIKDVAGNGATLTLASPGASNSLGANKAIVVDTTPPSISQVTSTTNDGTYKSGDVIAIILNFSEAVIVNGTPQLTLETGTNDVVGNYTVVVDRAHWFLIIQSQMGILIRFRLYKYICFSFKWWKHKRCSW